MSFWKNKKVLITGTNGFVGGNLTKRLIGKGAKVIALTRNGIKPPSLLTLENLVSKIHKVEKGSLLDFNEVNRIVSRNKLDYIFHLAAQPLIEVGHVNPIETFDVNIRGTWNLLEAARQNKVKKIVVASTTHVYGDNPNLPYKEEYYPQPSRPYETSKAAADLLAQTYSDTYGLEVEIPRFVNLYGPGDFNFSRIVPKVILPILKKENPEVWDVGAVRDFLYIDDAIDAYLVLVEKNLPKEKRVRVFNFGSGKPMEIIKLAQRILRIARDPSLKLVIKGVPEEREKEILKQYVSVAKAKRLLGWRPKYTLDEGLKETINWYTKFRGSILV
ncbi:MAG: NAD-dependent epimerase/dehydratase family protein [Patescibacteria group bacterium]